jgi:hypothetical protein
MPISADDGFERESPSLMRGYGRRQLDAIRVFDIGDLS